MSFTHLHIHSHLSLLEAVPQIPDLVSFAKKQGLKSLALTDTNNLYGAIEFTKECQYAGIKPIIGVEISVAENSMLEEVSEKNRLFKMVLLAETDQGYKNLVKIVSDAHITPAFKRYPCIDLNYLNQNKEGLFILSGLTESYLWEKLRQNDFEGATIFLNQCKDFFVDKFYIEIGNLEGLADSKKVRENTKKISSDLNIPLVATYNVYYLHTSDRPAQKVLMGISSDTDARERYKRIFQSTYYNFASEADAQKHFFDVPEALENVNKIAESCVATITFR